MKSTGHMMGATWSRTAVLHDPVRLGRLSVACSQFHTSLTVHGPHKSETFLLTPRKELSLLLVVVSLSLNCIHSLKRQTYYLCCRWCVSIESPGGMILPGENRKTRRKSWPSATFPTTNPTWADPGHRGVRLATNRRSHGMALCSHYLFPLSLHGLFS
jgi:hypothetical protein